MPHKDKSIFKYQLSEQIYVVAIVEYEKQYDLVDFF